MAKKICKRLLWCYPEEVAGDDRWRELELLADAEWDTQVSQEEAGHIRSATVRATTGYDRGSELVSRPYLPIALRGFTDRERLTLGSVLTPVLVELDTDELKVEYTFSCKYPA